MNPKSPFRLTEVKLFGQIYNQSIWYKTIQFIWYKMNCSKKKSMETALTNYSIDMNYLESLSNSDSQALKDQRLEELKNYRMQSFPFICQNIWTCQTSSLGFQNKNLVKLQLLINATLNKHIDDPSML